MNTMTQRIMSSLREAAEVLWGRVEKWGRDGQVCPEESRKALWEPEYPPDDPYKGSGVGR